MPNLFLFAMLMWLFQLVANAHRLAHKLHLLIVHAFKCLIVLYCVIGAGLSEEQSQPKALTP